MGESPGSRRRQRVYRAVENAPGREETVGGVRRQVEKLRENRARSPAGLTSPRIGAAVKKGIVGRANAEPLPSSGPGRFSMPPGRNIKALQINVGRQTRALRGVRAANVRKAAQAEERRTTAVRQRAAAIAMQQVRANIAARSLARNATVERRPRRK